MKKLLYEKIVLPEFKEVLEFEDYDDEGNGFCPVESQTTNYFPLFCKIIYSEYSDGVMYGYISTEATYENYFVKSDDFAIRKTKDCSINKTDCDVAYKKIVEQLRERYRQWVINNILFDE